MCDMMISQCGASRMRQEQLVAYYPFAGSYLQFRTGRNLVASRDIIVSYAKHMSKHIQVRRSKYLVSTDSTTEILHLVSKCHDCRFPSVMAVVMTSHDRS